MKAYLVLFAALLTIFFASTAFGQDADTLSQEQIQAIIDSLEAQLQYQTGTIELGDGVATLEVPEGFRYLDPVQSNYVLSELWGNPPAEIWGMLFPEKLSPLNQDAWAVTIDFSEEGFVSDEDATDIDYSELLSQIQEDAAAENPERIKQGYESIQIVGWASPPYYDHENKKLHWAKEIKFGDMEENTLNYNIRVLGRKGVMVLNAIGGMNQLSDIRAHINPVVASVNFNDGHRYDDFNPDIDEIAAYGIGGLIAGKALAKTGLLAAILKMWKLIAVGAVALLAAVRRFLSGKSAGNDQTG